MKIYFTNVGLFKRGYIKKVLEAGLEYLGQPTGQLEVSLSFVDEDEIRELNKEYRDTDKVTDVLSFPTVDNPERGVIDLASHASDLNPETWLLNLGDIIICLPRAKQQAKEYGHSLKREVAFLSLHSLLHLLGYDHMNQSDEEQMTAVQNAVLDKLNIKRNK